MDLMLLTLVLMAGSSWIPGRQEDFADFCRVWKEGLEDTAAGTPRRVFARRRRPLCFALHSTKTARDDMMR
ncbi:MAG: hypothetical protein LBL31_03585 [Spirochaetaceae bacterium]|jgi:hypothetical protein|nr:hypothetical protein [Spirochaetaceae bacterium]